MEKSAGKKPLLSSPRRRKVKRAKKKKGRLSPTPKKTMKRTASKESVGSKSSSRSRLSPSPIRFVSICRQRDRVIVSSICYRKRKLEQNFVSAINSVLSSPSWQDQLRPGRVLSLSNDSHRFFIAVSNKVGLIYVLVSQKSLDNEVGFALLRDVETAFVEHFTMLMWTQCSVGALSTLSATFLTPICKKYSTTPAITDRKSEEGSALGRGEEPDIPVQEAIPLPKKERIKAPIQGEPSESAPPSIVLGMDSVVVAKNRFPDVCIQHIASAPKGAPTAKVVIVGSASVGKTRLLSVLRSATNSTELEFIPDKPTLGLELVSVKLTVDDVMCLLTVWDTAGSERYRSMVKSYFRGAVGALVVFDVTDPLSFENVDYWIRELREVAGEKVQILLVGNKIDLPREQWRVPSRLGVIKAQNFGVLYAETSAKTESGVLPAFAQLAKDIWTLSGDVASDVSTAVAKEEVRQVEERVVRLQDVQAEASSEKRSRCPC